MRNLRNYQLHTITKDRSWLFPQFPTTKLNYTNEILFWYILYIYIKRLNLKKNKGLVFFKLQILPNNWISLKIITYEIAQTVQYSGDFLIQHMKHSVRNKKKLVILRWLTFWKGRQKFKPFLNWKKQNKPFLRSKFGNVKKDKKKGGFFEKNPFKKDVKKPVILKNRLLIRRNYKVINSVFILNYYSFRKLKKHRLLKKRVVFTTTTKKLELMPRQFKPRVFSKPLSLKKWQNFIFLKKKLNIINKWRKLKLQFKKYRLRLKNKKLRLRKKRSRFQRKYWRILKKFRPKYKNLNVKKNFNFGKKFPNKFTKFGKLYKKNTLQNKKLKKKRKIIRQLKKKKYLQKILLNHLKHKKKRYLLHTKNKLGLNHQIIFKQKSFLLKAHFSAENLLNVGDRMFLQRKILNVKKKQNYLKASWLIFLNKTYVHNLKFLKKKKLFFIKNGKKQYLTSKIRPILKIPVYKIFFEKKHVKKTKNLKKRFKIIKKRYSIRNIFWKKILKIKFTSKKQRIQKKKKFIQRQIKILLTRFFHIVGKFKNKKNIRLKNRFKRSKRQAFNNKKTFNQAEFMLINKKFLAVATKKFHNFMAGIIKTNNKLIINNNYYRYLNNFLLKKLNSFDCALNKIKRINCFLKQTKKYLRMGSRYLLYKQQKLTFYKQKNYLKLIGIKRPFATVECIMPSYLKEAFKRKKKIGFSKKITWDKKIIKYNQNVKIKNKALLTFHHRKNKNILKIKYLFIQKKIIMLIKNMILARFQFTMDIKFHYGVIFRTKFKRYLLKLTKKKKRKLNPYLKLKDIKWKIYHLMPFNLYSNISLILFQITELIGTKQSQHKIERRLRESAKKKIVKNPSYVLKVANKFHYKMEVRKRRQAKLMYLFQSLFHKMLPSALNFYMFRLKGKVNSRTRKRILKIKHNFTGIRLYNKSEIRKSYDLNGNIYLHPYNNHFIYQFIPIRAKIGAFGLHFFGGYKVKNYKEFQQQRSIYKNAN